MTAVAGAAVEGYAAVDVAFAGLGWSGLQRSSVRARPGRLRALRVSHGESVLYGGFVWARRALNL